MIDFTYKWKFHLFKVRTLKKANDEWREEAIERYPDLFDVEKWDKSVKLDNTWIAILKGFQKSFRAGTIYAKD